VLLQGREVIPHIKTILKCSMSPKIFNWYSDDVIVKVVMKRCLQKQCESMNRSYIKERRLFDVSLSTHSAV
jgi:hypothetical protein